MMEENAGQPQAAWMNNKRCFLKYCPMHELCAWGKIFFIKKVDEAIRKAYNATVEL